MRWQSVNANAEKKTVEFDFTDISADEEADYAEVKSSFDNGLQHPSLPEATSHPQPKKKPSRKRKNVVIQGSGANQEQEQKHDKQKMSRPKNKTLGTQQRKKNKDCFDDDFLSLDFIVHTKATTNDKEQNNPKAKENDKLHDTSHDNSHDKGITPPINIVVDNLFSNVLPFGMQEFPCTDICDLSHPFMTEWEKNMSSDLPFRHEHLFKTLQVEDMMAENGQDKEAEMQIHPNVVKLPHFKHITSIISSDAGTLLVMLPPDIGDQQWEAWVAWNSQY